MRQEVRELNERLRAPPVLVHQSREQRAVERAPVDADPHRLAVVHSDANHRAEVFVVLLADVDVAGVDAVLGERARALRILRQKQMPVVVKVADDGNSKALRLERLRDFRHGSGSRAGRDLAASRVAVDCFGPHY